MTPDFHGLISQMAAALDYYQQLLMDDRRQRHPLADRARTLLAEPVAEGPTDEEILAFCARYDGPTPGITAALRDFLARWGRPAAAPAPETGEARELVEWLTMLRDHDLRHDAAYAHPAIADHWNNFLTRAATLLQQQAAPSPAPVPVSERLPGPEDCDAEGRCWMFGKIAGDWRLVSTLNPGIPKLKYCFSHWLPANALPLPAPEGGEVS